MNNRGTPPQTLRHTRSVSRRQLLTRFVVGAAAAAALPSSALGNSALGGTPAPSGPHPEHKAELEALLCPVGVGTALAGGWCVASLEHKNGALEIRLQKPGESEHRVDVVRRGPGAPLGVEHTALLELYVMNDGGGHTATPPAIHQSVRLLALVLRTSEATHSTAALSLSTHADRA